MSLCPLCASITLSKTRGPNLDQIQTHQPSYLALKKSAETGCQLCGFFWEALEQGIGANRKRGLNRAAVSFVSERYPGRQISLVAWGGHGTSLDRIHIITTGDIAEDDDENAPSDPSMHPDHQVALDGVVDLYAYPGNKQFLPILSTLDAYTSYAGDPAAWHGGVTGRPLPLTAGDSEEDFKLAQTWLHSCLHKHSTCPKPDPETPLPTRVIDLGPSDASIEPYLLHSNGKKGLYVALSHCWGGKVPLTTTISTLEERIRSIPLRTLPKTFQEAAIATRRLGLRYLWIDSLCILQDSKRDWEKESAVMGDIYASSFLTIAARGAVNSADGLFILREPEPPSCRLPYACGKHSLSGSMYIRSPAFQTERLRDTPLDTRGWVLQERLLSPRILYYGRQQLYWECAESTFRQDGKGADVTAGDLRTADFKQSLDFNGPLPFNEAAFARTYPASDQAKAKKQARLIQWYNVVTEYSRRDLTYQSDKLPALSGIAKAFQKNTGYTYLAGLWKEDLIAGIAWYMPQPSNEVTSLTLPSWTWARLKGNVRFWSEVPGLPLRILDGSCDLVRVTYTLAGGLNPYGDIGDAELQICGRLIEATYRPPQSAEEEFPTTVFAMGGASIGRILFDLKAPGPPKVRSIFCVLIHGGDHYAAALALERADDEQASYKRVGYISVTSSGRAPFMDAEPRILSII
ncbi:HET-domain-containing protein [Trematosphaeria pertusa]|uniref:HET-domain-containing protein n=1 Tax=Trematosphaeria pertusa TaxID=390896 RepID=A0A6A6IG24_9PLEO|nr:HET-domain-containing protein [Trematosphaeria pertusa]KAF2248862.1 HET-domain-containing protein [Trematosphaeria pertusa]